MADSSKFYYYEIYFKEKNKRKAPFIEIKNIDSLKSFLGNIDKEVNFNSENNIFEYITFFESRNKDNTEFLGSIVKEKDGTNFFTRLKSKKGKFTPLSKETAVATKPEIANFVFLVLKERILILMQKGYQTAGMGVLKKIIGDKIDIEKYKLFSRVLPTKKNNDVMRALLRKKSKEFTVKVDVSQEIENINKASSVLKSLYAVGKKMGGTTITITCKVDMPGIKIWDNFFGGATIDQIRDSDFVDALQSIGITTNDNDKIDLLSEIEHELVIVEGIDYNLSDSQIDDLISKLYIKYKELIKQE